MARTTSLPKVHPTRKLDLFTSLFCANQAIYRSILKLCAPPKEEADAYRAKTQLFAKRGFRSLGVALQTDGKWQLLGLLP